MNRLHVTPVQAHPHRCSVAKESKVAEEIRHMEKQSIWKKVTEPTVWISNSVSREKPDGSLRVCIDPSQAINKAIEVPKHFIPTTLKLSNDKIVSCVDVYKGFTMVSFDYHACPNREIPLVAYAVWCKFGARRVTRSAGSEGLKGVASRADDILVFGSEETFEDVENYHDMNLWNLKLRSKEVKRKLNPKKFQFKLPGWNISSVAMGLLHIVIVSKPLLT